MGLDVPCQYLLNKFSALVDEAENDQGKLACVYRFRRVENSIKSLSGPSTIDLAIRNTLYNFIDALNECRVLAHQRRGVASKKRFKHLWPVVKLNRRLDDLEQEVENLRNQEGDLSVAPNTHVHDDNEGEDAIVGLDSAAEKIKILLDGKNYGKLKAIAILGMCGSGKTALARKVFDDPDVDEIFSPRIWVHLSETLYDGEVKMDLREEILRKMLLQAGCDVSELATTYLGICKLKEKLYHRLMGKRFLIVFDEVWHANVWFKDLDSELTEVNDFGDCISHALPKESGGRIIITSRRERVAREMVGGENLVPMDTLLSDELCWSVFSDTVCRDRKLKLTHKTLKEMKEEITERSFRLPLAARTLAEIIPQQIYERQHDL